MTPVPPGCTVSAPMLMEASMAPPRAVTASVCGLKTMFETVDVPALLELHTPPPVVPIKMRLPVASEGSNAMAEMRPVTRPKSGVRTAVGPSGCQVALAAVLPELCGEEAIGQVEIAALRRC